MKNLILILFSFLMICACREPFSPEVLPQSKNLLVVEGFINIGGQTTIKLSRTGELQDIRTTIPEVNAKVIIEGNNGTVLNSETGANGQCVLNTTSLSLSEKYRLKILINNNVYQTDYLESKQSPPIDSVNYKIENNGFQIYANTHDDTGRSRYYYWDYIETWEIRATFKSLYEYIGGQVVPRDPSINLERCWADASSTRIVLGSSEKLTEDRITDVPVINIKGNSEKVAHTYSILLRQYVYTKEGYQYYENIRKNTEQIGSIFDSQPSEIKGNIINLNNPNEIIVGWISAGTISEDRLFLTYKDKPRADRNWVYPDICDAFFIVSDSLQKYIGGNYGIVNAEINPAGTKYLLSTKECTDCRLKGYNIKPSFWPN